MLVQRIIKELRETEQFFRLGIEGAGNDALTRTLDSLMDFLNAHPQAADMGLNPILAEILTCQQQRDWIRAGDLLFYRLLPWLQESVLLLQAPPSSIDQ